MRYPHRHYWRQIWPRSRRESRYASRYLPRQARYRVVEWLGEWEVVFYYRDSHHAKEKKDKRNKWKLNLPKMPTKFSSFADCVSWIKKSTYLIVRWRSAKEWWKDVIMRQTLWTWVLVSPGRLITCFHVICGEKGKSLHNDADKYYLVRHDDLDSRHTSIFWLTLNKNLFLYESTT